MIAQRFHVSINISYDDFLPYYEGHIKDVIAPDINGKTIRFPASALQAYLTYAGVKGVFELRIDENNKLLSCKRVSDITNS